MILTITLNATVDKRYSLPEIKKGEVMRVESCTASAGGKGINVSRVAKIAGQPTVATGFAGGYNGHFILNELEKSGIECDFVKVDGETRISINIFEESLRRQTEILEPGPEISQAKMDEFMEVYRGLVKKACVVCLCGSIPIGVPKDIYSKLVAEAKLAGKPVFLDTSGEPLKYGVQAAPTVIKPNNQELKYLADTGDSVDSMIDAAQQLRKTGIQTVLVSMGADGALMVCGDGVYTCKPPKVKVENTVGCGDSMVAGFSLGMLGGEDELECFKKAMAYSAANTLYPVPCTFTAEDYNRVYSMLNVVKYK